MKPRERIGFCLTEGAALRMAMGRAPTALARLAGIEARAAGLTRSRDEIIARALHGISSHMHCQIVKAWQAQGRRASRMTYMGLVLEGIGIPRM